MSFRRNEFSSPQHSGQKEARLEELHLELQRGRDSLRREHAKTHDICKDLEKFAGVRFDHTSGAPPGSVQVPQGATIGGAKKNAVEL